MLAMDARNPTTPSRRASTQHSSSPLRSSPLNPSYRLANPPSQRRASLHNQFQSQSRYTRPVASTSAYNNDIFASDPQENPKNAVWRESFRRKVAERAERDRVDFRNSKRAQAGSGRPGSSEVDSLETDDTDMEIGDMLDDEVRLTHSVALALERHLTPFHACVVVYSSDGVGTEESEACLCCFV